jgi:large subunit ribosomal protein L2
MKKLAFQKNIIVGKKQNGGRSFGMISMPKRGALVGRKYRFIDFKRSENGASSMIIIKRNVYDPNRSGPITLVIYRNGLLGYIIENIYTETQKLVYNLKEPKKIKEAGWSSYLKYLPLGTTINNIESIPGLGSKYIRSAGINAVLLKKNVNANNIIVRFKSGGHRLVSDKVIGSVGIIGNNEHFLRNYKKAGTIRLLGRRPRVRPSVMNPVDHPMGGRTKGGCAPRSKTGKLSHGPSTLTKKPHSLVVVSARKSRKQRIS